MKNKKEEFQFEVRDLRNKNKFIMDDKFLNGYARFVGIYAVGVYNSLCRHANKEQSSWPSIKKIGEELGVSMPKIIESIKFLEFWRIIEKIRVGKRATNRYCLIDKKYWKALSDVNVVNFSDVNHINFTSKQRLLHMLTTLTSNSKETHSKETHSKEGKNNLGIYKDVDEVLREKMNEGKRKVKSFPKVK